MGEVVSYTKAAIDAMLANGGGGGGGGGLTQQQMEEYAIALTEKAAPNGVATLDAGGLIPVEQLPGGGGSSKVLLTDVALGNMPGAAGGYTWTEVTDACLRGLMSRFTLTGATDFDFELRDDPGGGNLWLAADDNTNLYDISAPVYIEGDADRSLWIGIKNTGAIVTAFTLTTLRVEAFA